MTDIQRLEEIDWAGGGSGRKQNRPAARRSIGPPTFYNQTRIRGPYMANDGSVKLSYSSPKFIDGTNGLCVVVSCDRRKKTEGRKPEIENGSIIITGWCYGGFRRSLVTISSVLVLQKTKAMKRDRQKLGRKV